ncbi:MAG: DUF2726 domain-containing protein [Leptothrix sp. (in: b-proteobacteria)]
MHLTALALLALAALVALWRRSRRARTPKKPTGRPRTLDAVDTVIGWPPEATRVMTLRHQRAMELLRRALPDHLILAQVPVSHFIKVPTRHSYVEWLRRVGHVCVDLMVCDADSNVIAVIEVRQTDRIDSDRARKRHARVERVLRGAGIALHVWNDSMLPDPVAVRRVFSPERVAPMPAEPDRGPDTSPLDPAHLPGRGEPPRTTWFDDLNATQPNPLDSVDVIDHPGTHFGSGGLLEPSTQGSGAGRR